MNGNTVPDSSLFGVSVRAWIALMLSTTVCAMAFMKIEVGEPLYSLTAFVVGTLFGQKPVRGMFASPQPKEQNDTVPQ